MARKWSNLNLRGALHFVTGNCINRIPVFTESEGQVGQVSKGLLLV
jgi:hypothetical protein